MAITTENRTQAEAFNSPLLDRERLQDGTGKLIATALGIALLGVVIRLIYIIV